MTDASRPVWLDPTDCHYPEYPAREAPTNPHLSHQVTWNETRAFKPRMVYFTTPNNGAVFSTGSIAFSQSLPHNNFDNNVSRLLDNIVSAFSGEGRLPGWAWTAEEKQWR